MRAEKGYPTVNISGFVGHGTLRTFLITEDPMLKFHPFYQVCKVMNKQGTSHMTTERKIDNITCIETQFQTKSTVSTPIEINSIGILKLKNSTVEAALGPTYFTPRSTRVRVCFMALLRDTEDNQITLQDISHPIGCSKYRIGVAIV